MDNINPPAKKAESKVGAGTLGVGGGTLLVILAQNLPANNPYKSWLVLIAPTLSVSLSGLWLYVSKKIDERMRKKEAEKLIAQAKTTIEKAIQNSLTSEEHREKLRLEYEQIELLEVNGYADRIRVLQTRG